MNYHSDTWIMDCVREHYNEALEHFPEDRIVCLVLQGSQNYGLDTMHSDIDTKCVLVPTFADLAMNRQPISTTHIRADDSHTDWKDIRLMLQTFRKCNLNFLLDLTESQVKIKEVLFVFLDTDKIFLRKPKIIPVCKFS